MLSKKAVSLGNSNNKRKNTAFSTSTGGSQQQDNVTSSFAKKTSTRQPPQPRELSQESTQPQFPLFASAGGSRQQDDGISSHAKKTSTPQPQRSTQPQQFQLSASVGGSRQQDDRTSSHVKKTRGITVGAGTYDVVKKSKTLIPIRMDPSQNLVANVEAQYLFVSEIGLITRNKAPLNVLGWKEATMETKKDMAIALQFKFDVNLTDPAIWKFVDEHMNSTYNDWRAKLHKHYKQYASDPEVARATPPPEKVFGSQRTLEEWHYLVDKLYTNEKYQKRCKANAENRKKKKYDHTGGSRPFLKHMEAAVKKGENPTYVSNWNTLHMYKDKAVWINEAAESKGKKMMEDYKEAKRQLAEGLGIELDQTTISKQQQLEIMTAELGVAKGKRIRGLGSNLRVESSSGRPTATSSLVTEQKVEELQGTVSELKGTVSELQGTVGKLLGVIEWMRTHVGALPPNMDMGVPPQHVGDPSCADDDDDDDDGDDLGH